MKRSDIMTPYRNLVGDLMQDLERDLLCIEGVTEVSFDEFAFELGQLILLTKYNIPLSLPNYYETRDAMVKKILHTANQHQLIKTQDCIEDYGEHLYFVFDCHGVWLERLHSCNQGES